MTKRGKWLVGITGVSVLLTCHAIANLHRRSVMHKPQVYLTQQRATQLGAFAEELLKERNCTTFELISHRWWLPTVIRTDSPLTKAQVRAVKRVLRENHLHRIALAKGQRTVTYGYASLRTWCYYIYVSDPNGTPQKGPCHTIRKVRDHWYFGTF